jgi:hypothetical protein
MSGDVQRNKARLHLALPERVRERTEQLQALSSASSITEVIRRAIEVFDLVTTAVKRGDKVILRGADGKDREVILV